METIAAISDYLHTFSMPVMLFRLVLAGVLSGIIGYSRSAKGRAAGFKTHVLVCIGSTLVMLTSQNIYINIAHETGDVARMSAQVIAGIGFLGTGTIMVTGRRQIKGLTTAAGLWTSACIGLAVGIGFYSGAIIAAVIIFILYRHMQWVNDMAHAHAHACELSVEFETRKDVSTFLKVMEENGYHMLNMGISTMDEEDDENVIRMDISLELAPGTERQELYRLLMKQRGIVYVDMHV